MEHMTEDDILRREGSRLLKEENNKRVPSIAILTKKILLTYQFV